MKHTGLINLTTCAITLLLSVSACKTPTQIENEYATYGFETECLGVDPDGSQNIRTWGKGKNKADAIEQAKRNAIETVIFKGITAGSGDCNKRPLVNEVNAREKYEDYFNAFFAKGGAFNKYVSLNEKRTSRIKSANSSYESWSVIVTVDRSALRKRLIDDNLISQ